MLRKTLLLTLLLTLLTACEVPAGGAPQAAPTVDSVPTDIPAISSSQGVEDVAVPTEEPSMSMAYTDGLGREITLEATPQRIVSLAPSNTEILFAVGAGTQVVGRDEFSDYPAEAASIEVIGGSFGEYNVEAIVALEPDLVLAAEINPPELVQQLEELGLTVYYLSNPTTLEGMYTNLETVAALSRNDATELVASLKARVAAIDEKIMPLSSRISVFYEIDATDPTKPWTYGPGTFGDMLISRAGGYNIGGIAENDPYPQLSLEQIVLSNPSVIILGDAIWGVTPESVVERAGWETIPAVKSNSIFPIDDNLISRPGPRLVDGLEQLAKLLRPGLFE